MNILVANDDGVNSYGIRILAQQLEKFGKVTVIAPDRDRSAASNSLTLDSPLRVTQLENGFYSVNGTPTDCVHLGVTGLLKNRPDLIVSGINSGANLGDDVLYSGTVAAAMEGRFLGIPAVAFSMAARHPEPYQFDIAGQIASDLIKHLLDKKLESNTLINVNIPNLPYNEIKGYQVARLGCRYRAEQTTPSHDPRGHLIYWVGPVGEEQDAGPGTDFHAIKTGYVSLTPLQTDLTGFAMMDNLTQWTESLIHQK